MFGLILVIGSLVDDAIVVVENVMTHVEQGMKPAEATSLGMRQITGAIIATTVSHGFQFVFLYIFAKRIGAGGFPFSMGDFIPWFLVVCVACIVYYLTSDLWIVRWGISVIMGTYLLIRIIKRKEVF